MSQRYDADFDCKRNEPETPQARRRQSARPKRSTPMKVKTAHSPYVMGLAQRSAPRQVTTQLEAVRKEGRS